MVTSKVAKATAVDNESCRRLTLFSLCVSGAFLSSLVRAMHSLAIS